MPLRNHRTVSFTEAQRTRIDPCVLYSVKSTSDLETTSDNNFQNPTSLPRSSSEPTHFRVDDPAKTPVVKAPYVSAVRLGPTPFNTVPVLRHSVKPKVSQKPKRSQSDQSDRNRLKIINPLRISAPQPLDLHGIPNGLLDIDQTQPQLGVKESPVLRRVKNSSPVVGSDRSKQNRRKAAVFDDSTRKLEISGPVLISHVSPSASSDNLIDLTQLKQRTISEQLDLLKSLESASNHKEVTPSKKKSQSRTSQLKDPDFAQPRARAATATGRMAEKIQKTIRALYDGGNSMRRRSCEKLMDVPEDSAMDDGAELIPKIDVTLNNSSPKVEKRATRKSRSPKPVRRMTVPVKDLDGSRRFKWRGSVNRIVRKFGQGQTAHGGTFEVHLEDCPPSQNNAYVPFVVDLCCRIVEERGLSFTGIYRVPGNSGTLTALQEELNLRGPDGFDITDERFCELNVVSSLLKSFFRKLPDPLFSNELYDDFIAMNRKKDPEERLNGLRRLVHMLPAPHYQTLKFLISHLRKVADNCDVNKMEVRNLAIVFGPTLVRSTISDNMATMVTDMSDQCRIVESVLQHNDNFFSGEHEEIPTFLRSFMCE